MLHRLFYFLQEHVSEKYDISMGVGYASNTLPNLDIQIMSEEKKLTLVRKGTFLVFHMDERYKIRIFSLITFDFKHISK